MAEQKTINLVNGIDMDVLQGTIGAIQENPELGKCTFRATNKWISGSRNRTTLDGFWAAGEERHHQQPYGLDCDEPTLLAGGDQAPNPVEHLLNALAGCITTGMVAHAAVRGIHIEELESELEGDIDLRGFLGLSDEVPRGYTNIRVRFKVKADVENMERLKRLTEFSPVLNTITQGARVNITVEPK
jgi:uncharacterized OsmC-like protein